MRKDFLGFLLLGFLCCFGFLGSCSAEGVKTLPTSEYAALGQIRNKLSIGTDLWDFGVDICNSERGWTNVSDDDSSNAMVVIVTCADCDAVTNVCHVISITLKSTNLTGKLPGDFANLTHLSNIDLSRNNIRGTIPASWGRLPLVNLSLLGNKISGEIPDEIGNISTLESLVLENNLLGGLIPRSLGNLKNLSRLLLSANNFVGELPASLGNLNRLHDFRIDGTGISGKIPSFIGNWTLLRKLDMQGTLLEGSFPEAFSNLKVLTELRVSDFKGDGTFPPIEGMELIYLILRNCSISGPIPSYLGSVNLKLLDLSFNSLTGEIPPSFQLLVQSKFLKTMYLSNNMLTGIIPDWIFGKKNIDLSYNSFLGPDKGQCHVLEVNLVSSFQSSSSNNTTSCLRKNLPCLQDATNTELFINCGGPQMIIDGIEYEANDYPIFAESTYNSSTNGKWAYSSTGVFAGNDNSMFVVVNASALKTTNPLYLSARTSASSLRYYGFCFKSGNYAVKLHFAEITFTDDQTYFSNGRRFFDVAIEGKKVLKDFNIAEEARGTGREIIFSFDVFVNNTLEVELRWSGKGTNAIPQRGVYGPLISAISVTPSSQPHGKRTGLSASAVVGIVIGCCLLIFLLILACWIILHQWDQLSEELQKLRLTDAVRLPSKLNWSRSSCFQKKKRLQGAFFSLNQIKMATKNFHHENRIGEGGFGPVYKGILQEGSVVAVKKLSSKSQQGNREFMNEIGMLSALQHPNLVKLYGCCNEGNQLLLIYEYLENNSLARALFGPEESRLNLDWQRRRKISLDVAKGLSFLHEESRLRIVHRDIKATNILLDKDLNAKISDFGLAKLRDEENTHISTRIAGTLGYMAPEYAMHGYLTEKVDVYSFGVVMLEIVSGKSNTDHRTQEDFVCLLDWAYHLQKQGKILELVDPSLGSAYSKSEAEQMLNLALVCTNSSYNLRPTMASVVNILEERIPVHVPVTESAHIVWSRDDVSSSLN